MADGSDKADPKDAAAGTALSFTTSLPTIFSARGKGGASSLLTPNSSTSRLPILAKGSYFPAVSAATARSRHESDKKLNAQARPEAEPPDGDDPNKICLLSFVCAFDWDGLIDEPAALPTTNNTFLAAVKEEIIACGELQRGFQTYHTTINSRKDHTFSPAFLM